MPRNARGSWLTLLLLLAVLVPSVCLLWFMHQAARNERLAAREKLVEAYRGHLALAQDRLNSAWNHLAASLGTRAEAMAPSVIFADLAGSGQADAAVVFDAAGRVAYPTGASPPQWRAPPPGWAQAQRLEQEDPGAAAAAYARLADEAAGVDQAALAFQAQARCLVRSGRHPEALALLTGPLAQDQYRHTADTQGRLIVPNAKLMALELLLHSASDQTGTVRAQLRRWVLDYEDAAMTSSQRRFLMRALQKLFPQAEPFPTLAAEDLAARYVEAEPQPTGEPGLRATALPGVWQFSPAGSRVITLYTEENLLAKLRAPLASQELAKDVVMDVIPPGRTAVGALLSLPAGPNFPGWHLALFLQDARFFEETANQRITAYVWTGVLVLAAVVGLAMLALGMVRRQIALTQLRNDLVANVTHELKTPLSSMRLLVETLLHSPRLHEKTAREYLELIAQENLRLSRLIDNFLTFSRIERNKYTFDFQKVPAASIAESAAAAVRERFQAPGCRFQVDIRPGLPLVMADKDAMVTALLNLLDNAWKYSGEEKEITLAASAENGNVLFRVQDAMVTALLNLLDNAWKYSGEEKEITLAASAENGHVLFRVQDNGIGLSPREEKQIFKRFHRAAQPQSATAGGCGLGLSIVRFVVTAHRGTVRVESTPGRGSIFIVSLPGNGSPHRPQTGS